MMKKLNFRLLLLLILTGMTLGIWGIGFWIGGCASSQPGLVPASSTTTSSTATSSNSSTTTTLIVGSWVPLGDIGSGEVPSIAFYNGTPYVAYYAPDGYKVMKYNSGSDSWASITGAGFSLRRLFPPSFYLYNDGSPDGLPYVAFDNASDGISVKRYNVTSGNWEDLGASSLAVETFVYNASLFIYQDGMAAGQPYLAYSSGFVGSAIRTVVRKYNKGTQNWDILGNMVFPTANPADNRVALYIYEDGTPYLAYDDYGRIGNGEITVMKYSAGTWEAVGPPTFTLAGYNINLQVYKDAISGAVPFAASNTSGVWKYSTSSDSWSKLGTSEISGNASFFSMFIYNDPTNGAVPYVAFSDYSANSGPPSYNSGWASVMKYNGTNWEYIGAPRFSDPLLSSIVSLYVYNGSPYITFAELGPSVGVQLIKVMKYVK
jgi:hypothetical protein